jgi:RHS repeat-associated protein
MSGSAVTRPRVQLRLVLCLLLAVSLVIALVQWVPHALAGDTAKTPVAPPGAGPVSRPLPSSAEPNHGYPAGQRPPVVPLETPAAGAPRRLSAQQWAVVPKPGMRHRQADGPPPTTGGARNVLVRPGFALDDTSLVVYFDTADPGISGWSSWLVTVYDPDTQAAQESKPLAPAEAKKCNTARTYCRTFGTAEGWSLVGDHPYFVTITVTLTDGTQVVSDPSDKAKARTTATPPALPAAQAAGCVCGNALAPTATAQAVRGSGVNTGTGGYATSSTDLRMAGFGVPFRAVRRYSSTSTAAGSMGVGWSWTYDVRVIPPAAGQTSVTVRAEDGAQVVYPRAADGSYQRPPGVRSNLSATATGWTLVTPDQVTYAFDQTGRLLSIRNSRGLGTSVSYAATKWTITDAAGRKVTVDLGSDGLVKAITLPDGRSTRYQYHSGRLAAVTDAAGATWTYGYTGQSLATITDPKQRVQITNTYAGGRVSRQADANGAVTKFFWAAGSQEATTIDPDGVVFYDGYKGNVLVYSQNGNGDTVNHRYDPRIERNLLVDAQGNQTANTYDTAGNVTATIAPDPLGFSVNNSFDARNNLTARTDGVGNTARYGYTAFDELQTITDAGGGKTTRHVDDRGLVTSVTDARGKVTTMTYDAAGNLVSRTTPLGERTTYAYDQTGRPVSMTDPRGNRPGAHPADFTTRLSYDGLDRLVKTDQPGKKQPSESRYDDLGQLVSTVDPLGDLTKYSYTKVIGRPAALTDPNGGKTTYAYTPAGRRTSVTDPGGGVTTYTYDAKGNLATTVSPRGNVKGANPADFTTIYFYDANNNVVRVRHTYPGGGFADTDTRFDELDRPVSSIDPLGKTSHTTYDNDDDPVSIVDALNRTTIVTYDANGRPSAVVAPGGGRDVTEYDPAGNPTKRTSATGGVTTWTYDDDGRLATAVDPRGNVAGANPADFTTKFRYDVAGNATSTTDPLGAVSKSRYDADNRLVAETDANGHTTAYHYDDADRLDTVTGPDAPGANTVGPQNNPPRPVVTRYTYDRIGNVVSRTDPNGHTSRYTYDPVNRLSSTTDPLDRRTAYSYDVEGDLTRILTPGTGDAAKRSIVFTYDQLDRRVGEDIAAGGTIYAWGYDAKNRLTSLADPAGLRLQTYDDADRLTKVSRGAQTFRYRYDLDSNVTSRTWPDGTKITAGYDADAQLTSLTAQGGAAGATARTYTFGYDPAGRPTTTRHPSSTGTVTDRGYDRAGRLTEVNSHDTTGTVAGFQLTLDPVGNPTSVVTTRGATSQTVGYTYDAADRVTSAATPTGRTTYSYDLVGNRTSQTQTGSAGKGTTTYSYDAADELTSATLRGPKGAGTVQFGYDQLGDQIKAGSATFSYNLDRTLATATVGGVKTSYSYDAQGLQLSAVSNTAGGPRTRSWATDVNATQPQLAVETTATATSSTGRGFLTGPKGEPLALLTGKQVNSYLPDWLGGVADVVSPQGQVRAAYDFDPYGVQRTDGTAANTPSTVDNPIRFTGLYQDTTLGIRYSTPTRTYDPSTGLFAAVDPVTASRTQPASSTYGYVLDRPTVLVDPTGADPCSTGGNGCNVYTPGPTPGTGTYSSTPPPYQCSPYMSPDTCLAAQAAASGSSTPPGGGNGNADSNGNGTGGAPPTTPKPTRTGPSEFQKIAADIAYVAEKISQILGFIPGFICGLCQAGSLLLGLVAALGYFVADQIANGIAALISVALGAILGGLGLGGGAAKGVAGKVVKSLVEKYGGKMITLARHFREGEDRVLRYVPSSLRAKIEWIVTGVTGFISTAVDCVMNQFTPSVNAVNEALGC